MQETWPGAKLTGADRLLLHKAVESDLRKLNSDLQDDHKLKFENLDSADLDLGSLGSGVIVMWSEPVLCGTGGCPTYVYVREKEGYRKVLGGEFGAWGWAFAVVKSKTSIPDLVVAGNAGGSQPTLTMYRYTGDTFAAQACEFLIPKEGETKNSWWDAGAVSTKPCSAVN